MPAPAQSRDAVIAAARVSLVRIALAFGLANAAVPLVLLAVSGGEPAELAHALAWVCGWGLAVANAPALLHLLERLPTRLLLGAMAGLAAVWTISATGGLDSPLKTGGNWLGWAATVVISARASLAFAAIFSAAITTAFLVSGATLATLFTGPDRYIVITGILNPFAVVLVALALAGVFRSVIAAAPGSLWSVRSGGPATSAGLTALFRSEAIPLLASGAADARDHGEDAEGAAAGGAAAGKGGTALPTLPGAAGTGERLTTRERGVVDRLAAGLAVKQIAHEDGRSAASVYDDIASAKGKSGARTIDHLVVLAWSPAA